MLQTFDKLMALPIDEVQARRSLWMGLLSRATPSLLIAGLGQRVHAPMQLLRPPQTGLMMMQARAGGTGERFNFGEVTITRCTLRLMSDDAGQLHVGVAHVLGRSHHHAKLAALSDALLQDSRLWELLASDLLKPIAQALASQRADREALAQSSKVEFFTVAREAGSDFDHEESLV